MSDRVQASGSTPVAPRDHIELGMSPLLLAFLLFFVFGVGGGPFLFVIGMSGQGGGAVVALILVLPWLFITAVLGIRVLTVLARGGARNHNRVKAAVREGRIGNSYYVRSWIGDNIIVVDEARRLLCLNGEILGFDSVRKLEWASDRTGSALKIVLASGANPIRNVDLGSEDVLKEGFERLCNSLGFNS